MLILVINCGSSSIKYQLFNIDDAVDNCSLTKGVVERIGSRGASLNHQRGESALNRNIRCHDHHEAIGVIVDILLDRREGVISSKGDISGIGHRVVHGGEKFKESTLITKSVLRSIEKSSELAPLHNPPSLSGINACSRVLKDIPQVAVFDTSFHQTMAKEAFLYGLPFKYYKRYGIRKYGFHGTSHRFIAHQAAKIIGRAINNLKIITCHLGNGCSISAVDRGKSIDTSMGLTPLEGLLMGTRSGDIDPAAVLYILKKENISLERMSDILNKESGLLGVSGVSNDMRDLVKAVSSKRQGSRRARLAIEMFVYRIKKYIGAYQAVMAGLDAIVFTGGIGENHPWLVRRIKKDLKNVVPRATKFMVIPTNEELLIAKDTYNILNFELP